MSFRISERCALGASLFIAALTAGGQDDLTLPPRIIDTPPAAARLELPTTPERADAMEEVLVVRENAWRLPDLGSEWRARQEEAPQTGRISASFFPLYDPEAGEPIYNIFSVNRELKRAGFIEIFRVRFGRR